VIAIRNYGFLWERSGVFFGKPGVSGTLLGSNDRVKKADFREQSGVYLLYDKNMRPVYVGQAGQGNARLFNRLKHHTDDHLWNRWEYVTWLGLCRVNATGSLSLADRPDRRLAGQVADALDEIEAVLIQVLEPLLNKQGPRWGDAEEFFQLDDEHLGAVNLESIYEKQLELESLLSKALKRK